MIYKYSIPFFVLILLCSSCTDKTFDDSSKSDLVIKTGTVCGWCTVNDTLTINGNNIRYVNYTNCSSASSSVNKTGRLETSELEDLLAKLDVPEFKKLDLNSCNVCFDGCDDWITLTSGTDSHTIRFSRDSKLIPIQDFVDKLNAIKGRYSGVN
jgi:hypothetical protein